MKGSRLPHGHSGRRLLFVTLLWAAVTIVSLPVVAAFLFVALSLVTDGRHSARTLLSFAPQLQPTAFAWIIIQPLVYPLYLLVGRGWLARFWPLRRRFDFERSAPPVLPKRVLWDMGVLSFLTVHLSMLPRLLGVHHPTIVFAPDFYQDWPRPIVVYLDFLVGGAAGFVIIAIQITLASLLPTRWTYRFLGSTHATRVCTTA